MPPASIAHVITCENRRFILQKDQVSASRHSITYQLFSFSFGVEEHRGTCLEYWKCVHRNCGVRLMSRGSFFGQLNGAAGHTHKPATATPDLIRKKHCRVERVLILGNLRPSTSLVSPGNKSKHRSDPYPPPLDSQDGTMVLKRLLLAGKERPDSSLSTKSPSDTYSSPSPTMPQGNLNLQLNPGSAFQPTAAYSSLKNDATSSFFSPSGPWWGTSTRTFWTPPVLAPHPEGAAYKPPPTPVASIGPYPEPQVLYNPYFLFQLVAYRESRNNFFPKSVV